MARGTLPGWRPLCKYANSAKATASLASPSKKHSENARTRIGATARSIIATNVGFLAPPPDRSTSVTGSGMNRRYASAMLRAVSAVAVATMSAARQSGSITRQRSMNCADVCAVEQLSSGGFGRRAREIRMLQQLADDTGDDVSARRNRTVDVVGRAWGKSSRDRVDHRNTRPGVERADALDLAARRQHSHVANSADVLERSPVVAGEQHRVGDGNEWRALSARGDVAHAKVAHDVDARSLGDDRRFTELPRRMRRLMPDRLTVRADRDDLAARHSRFGEDGDRRLCQPFAEIERETTILLRGAAGQRAQQPIALFGSV